MFLVTVHEEMMGFNFELMKSPTMSRVEYLFSETTRVNRVITMYDLVDWVSLCPGVIDWFVRDSITYRPP